MKIRLFKILTITALFLTTAAFSQADQQEPLSGIDNTEQYKSLDLVNMDKDLSIFANLLTLSGLNASMAMADQNHTLFVPSNEAFADMTIENFAELTNPKNRTDLVAFVKRHYISTKINSSELNGRKVITQGDDIVIPVSKVGYKSAVGGATIAVADIETSNGVIHVLDDIISITR